MNPSSSSSSSSKSTRFSDIFNLSSLSASSSSSPFSSSSSSLFPPVTPTTALILKNVWDEISTILNQIQVTSKKKLDEAVEVESAFQAKIDGLLKFQSVMTLERQSLITQHTQQQSSPASTSLPSKSFSSSLTPEQFWTKLADLDRLLERTTEQIDTARLRMYFPPARGYTYRLAANGVYLAIGDFWLSSVKAGFEIKVTPGQGQCWLPNAYQPVYPQIHLHIKQASVSLLITHLGLRGDQIPSTLRHVGEVELMAEVEMIVPLLFMPVNQRTTGNPNDPSSSSLLSSPSSFSVHPSSAKRSSPLNHLTNFQWQVDSRFKFEVTKLEVRTKNSVPVPNQLVRVLINNLVPSQIKKALTTAVPIELGILLALHNDHFFAMKGEISLQSIPMDIFHAVLENAVDTSGGGGSHPSTVTQLIGIATSHHSSSSPNSNASVLRNTLDEDDNENSSSSTRTKQLTTAAAGLRAILGLQNAGTDNNGHILTNAVAPSSPFSSSTANASANPASTATSTGFFSIPPPSNPAALTASSTPSTPSVPPLPSSNGSSGPTTINVGAASSVAHQARLAGIAARALGLTPVQARAFMAAQLAVPQLKNTPYLRSVSDIIEFGAKHNPKSTHRRTAAAALGPGSAVTGVLSSTQRAAEATEEALWEKLLTLWQKLIDEYLTHQLSRVAEAAANVENKIQQRAMMVGAQQRMLAASFGIRDLFTAAENMYNKPVRLHVTINELLIRVHAETAIGLGKALALHALRVKQEQATKSAANPGASNGTNSTVPTNGSSSGTVATPTKSSSTVSRPLLSSPTENAPSSLIEQIDGIHEWAKQTHSHARLVHNYVSRATASTSGWLLGGDRGQLSFCARQIQAECAQGVMLPLPMKEGFFPPGTIVTAMESRDEYSEALGWAAAGAQLPGAPTVATATSIAAAQHAAKQRRALKKTGQRRNDTHGNAPSQDINKGRGTFSVMLCWPRHVPLGRNVPAPPTGNAIVTSDPSPSLLSTPQRKTAVNTVVSPSPGVALPPVTSTTTVPPLPSVTATTDPLETSFTVPSVAPSTTLTPSDVEVLANIKLHRVWAGLRIEEAALLSMVHQRAEAVQAGIYSSGPKGGLPALHALEISFRPSILGSSYQAYNPHNDSSLATLQSSSLLGPLGGDVPPFPYVIGIETPRWTRLVIEAQAIEASGDVPVLVKQVGAMFESVVSAAERGGGEDEDDDEEEDDEDEEDEEEEEDEFVYADGRQRTIGYETIPPPSPLERRISTTTTTTSVSSSMDQRTASFNRSPNPSFASTSAAIAAAADAALDNGNNSSTGITNNPPNNAPLVPSSSSSTGPNGSNRPRVGSVGTIGTTVSTADPSHTVTGSTLPPSGKKSTAKERAQRREARDARRKYKAMQRAAAAAARDVASAEFAARLDRYLRSEDLRIAINLNISLLSVPAPPISGIDDELMEEQQQSSTVTHHHPHSHHHPMAHIDPAVLDIAGFDLHHLLNRLNSSSSSNDSMGNHRHQRTNNIHQLRKVLTVSISSHHTMQPTMIPLPGSAVVPSTTLMSTNSVTSTATTTEPEKKEKKDTKKSTTTITADTDGSSGGTDASRKGTNLASSSSSGTTVPSTATTTTSTTTSNPTNSSRTKTNAPVLNAPAITIDLQISLLTLLDDISVIRTALDTAGAISATI